MSPSIFLVKFNNSNILYKIELKEVELASSIIINKVASGHLSLMLFFSTPFIKILKIEKIIKFNRKDNKIYDD